MRTSGFSLAEVVLAVGILGMGVVALLAVLPGLSRRGSESQEALIAQGLPDAVREELTRLGSNGFESLVAAVPVMNVPLADGMALVASRSGTHVQSLAAPPEVGTSRLVEGDQFFLIEVWRFNVGPLAFTSDRTQLPVYVRISWPYRTPGSLARVAQSDRSEFSFASAVLR